MVLIIMIECTSAVILFRVVIVVTFIVFIIKKKKVPHAPSQQGNLELLFSQQTSPWKRGDFKIVAEPG